MKQKKNYLFYMVLLLIFIIYSSLTAQDDFTNSSSDNFEFTGEDFSGDGNYSKFIMYKGRDVDAGFSFIEDDTRQCMAMSYKIKSFNWDENNLSVLEVLNEPSSFSEYEGLSFWIKSRANGGLFNFSLMDDSNNALEFSHNIVLDTGGRWVKITIPFSLCVPRTRTFSKTDFNWEQVKSLSFGVALPAYGIRGNIPLSGKVFFSGLELKKKAIIPRTAIFNYLPKGYFLFEYYTDKEMPIVNDSNGKNYGIYMTYNWQDSIFFADQFSLNWKIAIPTHYTLVGKNLTQSGEVYRFYIPTKDSKLKQFAIGLKDAYLLYAPYTIPLIKRLKLGTQNFKWSDLSVFSTDQMLGLYWQGVVRQQSTLDAFVIGNIRNDKYFAGFRAAPQLNPSWKISVDSVYGMQYLKTIDSNGNALKQRTIAQDYSLYNAEIKGNSTSDFWIIDRAGIYGGFSTMREKDYGGVTQLVDESKKYVFINTWETPLDFNGYFCKAGTELEIKMVKLFAEYRIISSGYGGIGYKEELLRWANDPKPDLLMMERRRDLSLEQWKYRRLMRTTYDNQKGIGVDSSVDLENLGIIEVSGDYSVNVSGAYLKENRSVAGYKFPWKWLTPMCWWRWEQASDASKTMLMDAMYYEIGLTSTPLSWVELSGAYQYSWDIAGGISKNVYFGEIAADFIPNISIQFRVRFSDHPHVNEDLAGLVNSFRHDDIKELIDHMPDTYMQLLMKIII